MRVATTGRRGPSRNDRPKNEKITQIAPNLLFFRRKTAEIDFDENLFNTMILLCKSIGHDDFFKKVMYLILLSKTAESDKFVSFFVGRFSL